MHVQNILARTSAPNTCHTLRHVLIFNSALLISSLVVLLQVCVQLRGAHNFVNGLRVPRRGRLDVTSFNLEPLNKLQGVQEKKEGAIPIPFHTNRIS